MNPAVLIWALILAYRAVRALSGKEEQPKPAGGAGGEKIDAVVLMVATGQGFAISMLMVTLGPSWPAFFFSLVLVLGAPQWAAWRICQPRGWRRTGLVLLALAARGPSVRAGRRRLFEWSLGGGPGRDRDADELPATLRRRDRGDTSLAPADGWTTCAAALKAEALGNTAHADRLARGLCDLPARPHQPRLVRRIGMELLAMAALGRRDWSSVRQRSSLGRGRGCRFLRLLARAYLVGDVPAFWLWIAWALAPRRRATWALTRQALAAAGPSAPADDGAARTPWAAHVALLARAAAGGRIERAEVLRLARRWEGALGPEGQARLRARGLELAVLDPEGAAREVYDQVAADLESLAAVASGPWPLDGPVQGLAALLLANAEDRLYSDLEPWIEPWREGGAPMHYPLDEWDRWLALRQALDRLEEALGPEAVASSWYGGLREAAWNWPCRLLDAYAERAAWACHVMFDWTVALAERVGDDEAAQVNRRNVAAAVSMIPP